MIKPDKSGFPEWFVDVPHDFEGDCVGLDTSRYQGVVPWKECADFGYKFAFVKATDGPTTVDAEFDHNWLGLRAEPKILGGTYHFAQPSFNAELQGKRVLVSDGVLGRCLDLEKAGNRHGIDLADWVEQFCLANEAETKSVTIIYTGGYFWNETIGKLDARRTEFFRKRPLFLAAYTHGPNPRVLPYPWQDVGWTFWQFDGDGGMRLPNGVDVDVSLFAGDFATLQAFTGACRAFCIPKG